MYKQVSVFSIYLVLLCCSPTIQLYVGDACNLNSGERGRCSLLGECPSALQLIAIQQFPPRCGFEGNQVVVCCSSGLAPQITTSSTTTTTTTTRRPIVTPRPPTPPPVQIPIKSTTAAPSYREGTTGYKSYRKCLEYAKLVYKIQKPPTLIIYKEDEEIDQCGFKVAPLIVGGELTLRTEFPHMVLVGYDSPEGKAWKCGGTLISERFVLTAGHCLISRDLGNAKYARMGVANINDRDYKQDIDVIEIIQHQNFLPPSHYNDIGLLRLKRDATLNQYARPACLFTKPRLINKRGVASGWGRVDFVGASSDDLLKVTLNMVDAVSCNESFKRISERKLENGIIDSTQICAGAPGKDTCQGDSGGPLQIYSDIKCMYEIIGITSFGKACGIGISPGVYTRVSNYIKWIEDIVWP